MCTLDVSSIPRCASGCAVYSVDGARTTTRTSHKRARLDTPHLGGLVKDRAEAAQLGGGQEDLRVLTGQLQHGGAPHGVELRGRVVEQQEGPLAGLTAVEAHLAQLESRANGRRWSTAAKEV